MSKQQSDFGKDLGLIHEVVLSGRKVGADKNFWVFLSRNPETFSGVVKLVENARLKWLSVDEADLKKIKEWEERITTTDCPFPEERSYAAFNYHNGLERYMTFDLRNNFQSLYDKAAQDPGFAPDHF